MDSKGIIRKRLAQHRDIIEQILADEKLQDTIAQITDTIVTCFKYGGRVYFCGNGGSAADAQHLAAEFSGKFYLERDILPSEALHCNSSYITAVSNDLSFEIIYSRLISGIGKAGDVLVVLEAMKMEIEVSAPADGTVKSVSAVVGTAVNTDDLLVTIG